MNTFVKAALVTGAVAGAAAAVKKYDLLPKAAVLINELTGKAVGVADEFLTKLMVADGVERDPEEENTTEHNPLLDDATPVRDGGAQWGGGSRMFRAQDAS